MVGAMVVCSCAAPAGVAANLPITKGPNSQVLATAIRVVNDICGPSARSIPLGRAGDLQRERLARDGDHGLGQGVDGGGRRRHGRVPACALWP